MAKKDISASAPRRETVGMMRWSDDDAGVLSFEAEICWAREVRARNISRKNGGSERRLTAFQPAEGFMDSVFEATKVAAETARAFAAVREMELGVVAELWEVPCLVGVTGALLPLPEDWFLDVEEARNLWLLAASRGTTTEEHATRPESVMLHSAEVWSSRAGAAANSAALAAFARVVAALVPPPGSRRPRRVAAVRPSKGEERIR